MAAPLAGDAPSAVKADRGFEALRAAWARLDAAGRETVLRVAKGLSGS